MTSCDLETSVPDWIIEHPQTLAVFLQFGLDYSCGGKSLRYLCQQQGVNAEYVLDTLLRLLNEGEQV